MQPIFWRINTAINLTLEYYEIERIKDWMLRFAKAELITTTPHILDEWLNLLPVIYKRMEEEINQTIHTTNDNTKIDLFENLKEWLTDYRIEDVNEELIKNKIELYNEKELELFQKEIDKKDEEFKQHPNYKMEHLEEYEVDTFYSYSLIPTYMDIPTGKKTEIYYKFYSVTEKAQVIDTAYLPNYFVVVKQVLEDFKRIVNKYVTRYNEGKIVSISQIVIEKNNLLGYNKPKLLEPKKEKHRKIKVNLTIPQLAYLFKLLHRLNIISVDEFKEIHEFIANNFEVQSKKKGEIISTGKIARLWSNFDIADINFWKDKAIDLSNEAKKDNPNRIK